MTRRKSGLTITQSDLKKLKADGKIKDYTISKQKTIHQVLSLPKPEAKEKVWIRENIAFLDEVFRYKIKEELKFHETRRWRFDFAVPELKLAIEYEGLMAEKSRHTTTIGYTGDSEKYNEAQRLGWIVLRYTVLNYQNVVKDITNLLRDRIKTK